MYKCEHLCFLIPTLSFSLSSSSLMSWSVDVDYFSLLNFPFFVNFHFYFNFLFSILGKTCKHFSLNFCCCWMDTYEHIRTHTNTYVQTHTNKFEIFLKQLKIWANNHWLFLTDNSIIWFKTCLVFWRLVKRENNSLW